MENQPAESSGIKLGHLTQRRRILGILGMLLPSLIALPSQIKSRALYRCDEP